MNRAIALMLALAFLISGPAAAQTWEQMGAPQVATAVRDISVTTSGTYVFVADDSYLLKSTNSGQGYAVTPLPYTAPLVVLVKPNDSSKVVVAKNGELKYNSQGGAGGSWDLKIEDTTLIPLRLSAAVTDNNIMLLGRTWVSDNRAIWRSTNGGAAWSWISTFIYETSIYDFAPYPDTGSSGRTSTILAAGRAADGVPDGSTESSLPVDAGLWKSADYGLTWEGMSLGNKNLVSVAVVPKPYPADYYRIVVEDSGGGTYKVHRATNLGHSWSARLSLNTTISMVRLKKSNHYLFLATGQGVYRSTDEGENWAQVNNGLGNDLNVLSVAPTATGNTVYAGTSGSLYRSTDNGATWVNVGDMDVSSVEAMHDGSGQVT